MPTTDPYGQGVQIASLTDAPDAESLAQALAGLGSMLPRTVLVYASAAARAAALTGTTAPTAGMVSWLTDVKRLDAYDGTSWVPMNPAVSTSSSGASAAAGFSLGSFSGRTVRHLTTINIALVRTSGNISADSAGNIADTVLGSLPPAYSPPEALFVGIGDGFGCGECQIGSDGTITLRAWSSNGAIVTGRSLRITCTWVGA